MWHYLYFLVLVRVKDPTEYTGPESYVAQMIGVSGPRHKSQIRKNQLVQQLPQYPFCLSVMLD